MADNTTREVVRKGMRFYDDRFYRDQVDTAYYSGRKYAELLSQLFPIHSVVDVGCGRGAWLKAFKECGAETLVGVDGSWNSQANMIEGYIKFVSADLNRPNGFLDGSKFDLAMSVEVAEHLQESSAAPLVQSLTRLADAVLFGAAYTKQGGNHHVNEQPNTYWAEQFARQGYAPFDVFRPVFWGDKDIAFWYQQNTFLYVRRDSDLFRHLTGTGTFPLDNLAFMDCVHPALYAIHTTIFRKIVKNAVSALLGSQK